MQKLNPNGISRLVRPSGFTLVSAEETRPIPLGAQFGLYISYMIWQIISMGLKVWTLSEREGARSRVFKRVLLISGMKEQNGNAG